MLARLLDRLAQWVRCEPKWAGMWDDDSPDDEEPLRFMSDAEFLHWLAVVRLMTGLTDAEIDDLGGMP